MNSLTNAVAFIHNYVKATLWANTFRLEGKELVPAELDPNDPKVSLALDFSAVVEMSNDCCDFLTAFDGEVEHLIERAVREHGYSWAQAGHDFALTRNGHGAGFWDRGLGEIGQRLTDLAKVEGEFALLFDGTRIEVY